MSEAEKYRQLALETRAKALQTMDAYDKRTLLLVAQRYDVLVERARRREEAAKHRKNDVRSA